VGEGTDHVKEIAQEIDELRDEMTPLITELDRRRRDALDWRLQARQHLLPVSVAALAIAGLAGYAIWSSVHERHERHRAVVKARRLRTAVGRMIDEPERVAAADPSGMRAIGVAIARTAATTAASIVVRKAVERYVAAARTAAPAPAVT